MCEMCSKLTKKYFIVDFEDIQDLFVVLCSGLWTSKCLLGYHNIKYAPCNLSVLCSYVLWWKKNVDFWYWILRLKKLKPV